MQLEHIDRDIRHLATMAETASEGIAITDARGVVQYANTVFAAMHGYASATVLTGVGIEMFHSYEQMQSDVLPLMDEVKCRGAISGPIEHIGYDGAVFPTTTKIVPLRNTAGEAEGFIFLIVDTSKQIHDEKLLLGQNLQLSRSKTKCVLTGSVRVLVLAICIISLFL